VNQGKIFWRKNKLNFDSKTEIPNVLGKSLKIVNNDIEFINGTLQEISDKSNLNQGLRNMIETPLGTDFFNTTYGFDLHNIISQPTNIRIMKELIKMNIVKSLSMDNRIREIREIVFHDDDRFFELNPDFDKKETVSNIRKCRKWKANVIVETIDDSEITLTLEGASL